MTITNDLAARLRDDLVVNTPQVVRALPIAEKLSLVARLDLVRAAKSKTDGIIRHWPAKAKELEAQGTEPAAIRRKANNLKRMDERLSMAIEIGALGPELIAGDAEQAINLTVAWLVFQGGGEISLPCGAQLDISGKMTLH